MRLYSFLASLVLVSSSLVAGPHLHGRGAHVKQTGRPQAQSRQPKVKLRGFAGLPVKDMQELRKRRYQAEQLALNVIVIIAAQGARARCIK